MKPTNKSKLTPSSDIEQSLDEKVSFLKKQLSESIEYVRNDRHRNQRRASFIKMVSIVFSGSATILLGLQISGNPPLLKEIAFVLTALVTLFSSLEPFYNFRGLWVEDERAEYQFHRLLDRIEFYIAGLKSNQIDPKQINEFNRNYQEIWVRLSESQLEQRQSNRYNS